MKDYLISKINKIALDTNILVNAYQNNDLTLKTNSIEILKTTNLHISHFVFVEFLFVLKSKKKIEKKEAMRFGNELLKIIEMTDCTKETYNLAYFIIKRYDCSLPDSIVIADAILNKCNILYSRDMQHNQIFEKKTRIVNPYRK